MMQIHFILYMLYVPIYILENMELGKMLFFSGEVNL